MIVAKLCPAAQKCNSRRRLVTVAGEDSILRVAGRAIPARGASSAVARHSLGLEPCAGNRQSLP
jgi:hypothetical protein